MAATLQQPQHPNPKLKRLVYSKYRELLGSYNDKANTIIQALPAYMVTEDKGFNFHVNNDHEVDDEDHVDYSAPLPPTMPANGSIPARRIQTQAPAEPPACVQNAMMTKDKKPFTYTPGGIDLSQIKSPRMAKRIARNAQHEGVTNQPKQSPLAQENQNYMSGSVPAAPAAPPPASAMGVPVQVFPTGPPPPPPPMSSQLSPHANGRDTRKSPTPQNFEPPPLGCRPEIKIPENPMATLRKVPKPQPKNDFWVDEYRKERSKSPMPDDSSQQEESANQQAYHDAPPRTSSPTATKLPANNVDAESDPRRDPNRIAFQQERQQPSTPQYQPPPIMQYQPPSPQYQPPSPQYHPPTPQYHPPTPQYQPPPMPQPQFQRPAQPSVQQQQSQEPSYPPHMDPNRVAFQQQRQQPYQPQAPQQREVSPVRTAAGYCQQPQRHQPAMSSPNVQRVDSPFRVQENPNLQRPLSPMKAPNSPAKQQQQQQSPQSPYYSRPAPQQQPQQYVASPPPQQKPTQVGSLYIAPVPAENLAGTTEQPRSAGLQQTPPWLSQRANMKENPDWVREVNSPPTANRTQTPPINNYNQPNNGPGLRLQMAPNVAPSNPRERIIPIQMEKTPTPTRTPSTPGFGPQPYSPNNQYGSVPSPGSGYSTPNAAAVARTPNQFVDQGYNSFPNNQWQNQQQQQQPVQQQRVMSPPAQQGAGRIIPIAIERDEGPFSPNSIRGPISPTPIVIQNDPRGVQQPFSPNGTAPNQSKSFRVLQKITDTDAGKSESDGEQPVELHEPQYSKQMGGATDQMRRMQLNDPNQQAYVNRGDPRYRGATVPSKTFQKLKSMTDKCADVNTQRTTTKDSQPAEDDVKDDIKKWGPIQKQTQRYVQQRPIYQQDDQPQQYVHPSEQQVQEPKIYTGSAIPSRSFKLLQAMTTPENAVETEDTRVVENEPQFCPPCYSIPYPGSRRSLSPNPNDLAWQSSQERNQFYQPYSYYYPQYDAQGYNGGLTNGFENDQNMKVIEGAPDIVITSSPDEDDDDGAGVAINTSESPNYEDEPNMNELKDTYDHKNENNFAHSKKRESLTDDRDDNVSIFDILSRRLIEMTSPVYDEKASAKVLKNITKSSGEDRKSAKLSSSSHENSPDNSDKSDDESDDLITNSSSSSDDCANDKIHNSKEGLHAIKSVTDIKVYDKVDEDYQKDHECMRNYQDNGYDFKNQSIYEYHEDEENTFSYDQYKTNEEEGIVDGDSDTDGEDKEYRDDVEIRDQLSVIYEEEATESAEKYRKKRTESMNSTSSTLSECSTTIANGDLSDEDDPNGSQTDGDEDCFKDDEEENSVTVRLPLRVSFSRSSNDENITTVVVGDSEIQDSRRSSLRTLDGKDPSIHKDSDDNYDDDHGNDVSVTISLTSRSNSMDRSGLLSKTPSVDHETSTKDWDDSDSESVSISVSLPMKRNKFMTQTLNNDVTNDIHEIKFDWDKRESEESDQDDKENVTRKDDDTIREFIPETIAEEEDQVSEEEEIDEESEGEDQNEMGKDVKYVQSNQEMDKSDEKTNNHTNKEYNVDLTIDLSPRQSAPRTSTTETSTGTPTMLDALRELRIWNENASKRATLERELESKREVPKLLIDLSFEDLPKFENGLWNSPYTKGYQHSADTRKFNGSDDDDTETSTSESTSSESEELSPCVNGVSTKYQQKLQPEKINPLNESLSFVLEETTRKYEEALKKFDHLEKERSNGPVSNRNEDQSKLSVREKIAVFEAPGNSFERSQTPKPIIVEIANNNTVAKRDILSRNSSVQRSESEQDEDDSGVTSDMSKPVSENDTDPECFPELRRMSRYQRASTHSRLFKLLQDDINSNDNDEQQEKKETAEEAPPKVVMRPKKKIVHNTSIMRRSNPEALQDAETMVQRRERLSLPLKLSTSIDADNPSTSNSPSSPALQNDVSEQLVTELIESLLLKKDSRHLRNIPWSKLQAAAKKALLEDIDVDSLENTSIESTPALTPQDSKKEYQKSYSDYYDTWDRSCSPRISSEQFDGDSVQSPTFRNLQNQSPLIFRPVRCPRLLSSKTLNRDLSRLTESRESESPDRYSSPRSSATPERSREYLRGTSLSRIGKV